MLTSMINALLIFGMLVFAIQAIRAERLLHSAVWLAGVSATLALMLYRLGAYQVAVIELSVGAGLVTVLFVFAIGMTGEETINWVPVIPKPLAWGLVIATLLLSGWMILPFGRDLSPILAVTESGTVARTVEAPVQVVIWEQRGLDVLVQVVLIFSGVLGLLGLLAEATAPLQQPVAEEVAARRDRELLTLEEEVAVEAEETEEAVEDEILEQEKVLA